MSYLRSYHNTTEVHGEQLRLFENRCGEQEQAVLAFFAAGGEWSPSQVWQRVLPFAPLTSVRRAITNLTRSGRLVKTSQQRTGPYGRPECIWRAR
jgi:hypothetical protein